MENKKPKMTQKSGRGMIVLFHFVPCSPYKEEQNGERRFFWVKRRSVFEDQIEKRRKKDLPNLNIQGIGCHGTAFRLDEACLC